MFLLQKLRNRRHETTAFVSRPYIATPALRFIKSSSNFIPLRVGKLNTLLRTLLHQRRITADGNRFLIPLGGSSLSIGYVLQRLIGESRGTRYRIYLGGSVELTRFVRPLRKKALSGGTPERDPLFPRRIEYSGLNSRKNTLIGRTNSGLESYGVTRRGRSQASTKRRRLHGELGRQSSSTLIALNHTGKGRLDGCFGGV